jgi:hypothetical protein
MANNMEALVKKVKAGSKWDLGNGVLYDMCRKYPKHTNEAEVVAKVWLIGRSYAAAIERRRPNKREDFQGDDFYFEVVAPKIIDAKLDNTLASLAGLKKVTEENIGQILVVHAKVMNLFKEISGLEKRSLASKYLHFHFPDLFFIYDSRAVMGISKLNKITGHSTRSKFKDTDNEYRKFCEKCLVVRDSVLKEFGEYLTPRQLDNLILSL